MSAAAASSIRPPTGNFPPERGGSPAGEPPKGLALVAGFFLKGVLELARACRWLFDKLQDSHALYSLKTFGAGLLALYLSFRLDLSQPSWSLMTVYVVAQPLAGMVLSKAFARVAGTLIGAAMALALVAVFYDVQPLFIVIIVIIAAWIGGCLYFSVYLREVPAAYGAMLSGYTAAIIGFSAIAAPNTIFETAKTRCIEIILGIVCATVVSHVVLPRSSGRVFHQRIAGVLEDIRRCLLDALRGGDNDSRRLRDLKKLIADSLALESLRVHAALDTRELREAEHVVRALQGRVLSLFSLLVSLNDRIDLLRRERPAAAQAFEPLLARVCGRIELLAATAGKPPAATAPGSSPAPSLTMELLAQLPDAATLRRDPRRGLEYNIILRLIDLLAQWQEINRLKALLAGGQDPTKANLPVPPPEDTRITRYRDRALARVAAVGAFFAVVGTAAFWVLTGWPNGYTAAIFAGVVSCTLALMDNPAQNALRTLKGSLLAMLWAAVYLFAVLPRLETFWELAGALALIYVPLGMLMPSPRFGAFARPMLIYGSSFMGYHNVMAPDFAEFLNTSTALLCGILGAMMGFRLFRPGGAEWAVRRHLAGIQQDLGQLAGDDEPGERARFETRMLDRINAVTLRLNMDDPGEHAQLRGVMTTLRVGLNLRRLRRILPRAPETLQAPVRAALEALSAHFYHRARAPHSVPEAAPLTALDTAIQAALAEESAPVELLVSLQAVRVTLARHAAFYGLTVPALNPLTAPAPC